MKPTKARTQVFVRVRRVVEPDSLTMHGAEVREVNSRGEWEYLTTNTVERMQQLTGRSIYNKTFRVSTTRRSGSDIAIFDVKYVFCGGALLRMFGHFPSTLYIKEKLK